MLDTIIEEEIDYTSKLKRLLEQELVSQEKSKVILNLLNINQFNKSEIMNFCIPKEEQNQIDTAYPEPYANQIRELLPNWNGMFNVYDYRVNRVFGSMTNIAELFTNHIFKTFSQ
jgi:hypothetical protein